MLPLQVRLYPKIILFSAIFLEFHLENRPGYYDLDIKNRSETEHRILSGAEMVEYYLGLIKNFPSNQVDLNILNRLKNISSHFHRRSI